MVRRSTKRGSVEDSVVTSFDDAVTIAHDERDWQLDCNSGSWPTPKTRFVGRWNTDTERLFRTIVNDVDDPCQSEGPLAVSLQESILRFPSAPIHGVQRLHRYHTNLPESQSFHTYRVLTAMKPPRIGRIFLFHNGLNELDRMGLYYQLASHLIREDESAACILRPFPGHLTRAPFADFPENPLHRYLWDGSHLFRQFLRYMTETQWFLSALVRRSQYPCLSGAALLAENRDPVNSRTETGVLKEAMYDAWQRLYCSSRKSSRLVPQAQTGAPKAPSAPDKEIFGKCIGAVRAVLGLDKLAAIGPQLPKSGERVEPFVHVIGYSLGGFAAQSVFMSWPFLIASCSTLLSGGALRELSPTAFASPEEWQTVLHSLRYEIDDGMLDTRYMATGDEVAGLKRELFQHFQRTFYEVFEQQYRGSFQTRLAAFRHRMLFVVGGDDPIVKPQSVLDSSPPGGVNLLEIGGLGHFLGTRASGVEEEEQRRFWLPEMGRLMGTFAAEAGNRYVLERDETWLNENWELRQPIDVDTEVGRHPTDVDNNESTAWRVRTLREQDVLNLPKDGALSSKLFGLCLDDILARHAKDELGRLMVIRNEAPAMLLHAKTVQHRARAFHHDDLSIIRYCRAVRRRWEAFRTTMPRTRLVMPWNAHRLHLELDPPHGFPSQSETTVGNTPHELSAEESWEAFLSSCAMLAKVAPGAVSVFDGREPLEPFDGMPERAEGFIAAQPEYIARQQVWVPSLPDCWIWMSSEFVKTGAELSRAEADERFIATVHELLFPDSGSEPERLSRSLHNEELRVVTVSRARYNPRFRGRLIIDVKAVRQILLHAALCLAVAYDHQRFDLESDPPRPHEARTRLKS